MASIGTYTIKVIVAQGTTITDRRLVGREVTGLIVDDMTKNTGFSKPRASDTLTFTDGTEVYQFQNVTILLQ